MHRPAATLACLAAVAAAGLTACGDSSADKARKAVEGYVHDLGDRDGEKVCADMTPQLRRTFVTEVTKANPQVTGLTCGEIMAQALRSLPSEQLDAFATAKIESVEVDGDRGTFVYRFHDVPVDGKVAKVGDAWKVSCCVPGQQG